MRSNKELLQLLLKRTEYFINPKSNFLIRSHGLCQVIQEMYYYIDINYSEKVQLITLINLFDHPIYGSDFWWKPEELKPRTDWLTKILKRHYG